MSFGPRFTISNAIAAALTRIERARGFLDAAKLSEDWIRRMGARALVLEVHHTTHIEGTRLTLAQSERLLAGETVPEADPDDARELLNYRRSFEFVSGYLGEGGLITEGVVREIHRRLVEGVRGGEGAPGDLLARGHGLSERQARALAHVVEAGRLTIHEYQALCPGVNRRTLQRDLKALVDMGLLVERGTGPTDPTKCYRLAEAVLGPEKEL